MNEKTIRQTAIRPAFRVLAILAITGLVATCSPTSSLVAQGLDTSFGSFGAGTVSLSLSDNDVLTASTVAADGSIYLAGTTEYGGGDQNVLIARFGSDGILDTSFGGIGVVPDGMVVTDVVLGDDTPLGIAAMQDGKLLALVRANQSLSNIGDLVLLRYLHDGSLDNEFGLSGKITLESELLPNNKPRLEIVDGKILTWNDDKVTRYELDGSIDNTFGTNGTVEFAQGFHVTAADFDDTKMYFGGGLSDEGPTFAAFDQNGVPDPSFGVDGMVQPPFGVPHFIMKALVVHDGKMTVADASAIYRIDFNGNLDGTFDVDGIASNPEFFNMTDLILQPYGLITASVSNTTEFKAVRLNKYGQLDTTFGNDSGWMRFSTGSQAYAKQLFGYANGKVLMVGDFEDGETGESSLLAIRTAGFPKPTARPTGGVGNVVTIPGTDGDDRIEILQNGSATLVNYPDVPGYVFEFDEVQSVVVESEDGDDQIKLTFESAPLDPNQPGPVQLDIRSGLGNDEVYFRYFGSLSDATPTFDLGIGHDRLSAYVESDCQTEPHAFEYYDGRIRRALGNLSPKRQIHWEHFLNWYIFDEDKKESRFGEWPFIEPCQTGNQLGTNGLKIILKP